MPPVTCHHLYPLWPKTATRPSPAQCRNKRERKSMDDSVWTHPQLWKPPNQSRVNQGPAFFERKKDAFSHFPGTFSNSSNNNTVWIRPVEVKEQPGRTPEWGTLGWPHKHDEILKGSFGVWVLVLPLVKQRKAVSIHGLLKKNDYIDPWTH